MTRHIAVFALLPVLVLTSGVTLSKERKPHLPATWDDLQVGQLLEVRAVPLDENTIVVGEIELSGVKLEAPIEDLDAAKNSLAMLGVKVFVDPHTKIARRDETPRDFSTLKVGQKAIAKGLLQEDGTVTAHQITLLEDETDAPVKLEGAIQALNQDHKQLRIVGIDLSVSDDTEILFEDIETEQPLSWHDLQVGQVLDVGLRLEEDTIVASEIEISSVKLQAPIQNIDAANNSLTMLGTKVVLSPDAKIADSDEVSADLSSLQSGSTIVVQGILEKDGTIDARQVTLLNDDTESRVFVGGILQSKGQEQKNLKVLGITVPITDDTQIVFD